MQTITGAAARAAAGQGTRVDVGECTHPDASFKHKFDARDYITGDSFEVGFCRRCGLFVTRPVPAEAEIGRYYPFQYYGAERRFNSAVEWLLHRLYNYRVKQIESHHPAGKVLDIGCGRGLLLAYLRDHGWDTYGTELSEESASYARDVLKLKVYAQPVEEIGFPDGEFDLVVLWHVLEHVPDPRGMLQTVSKLLKPGGMLLVAVPNFGSWEARWARQHWFHLDVPRHLTHFTRSTLRHALRAARMDISSANFFSSEYDFYSFVQSAQNKLGPPQNLLYNVLRSHSAKLLHADAGGTRSARLQAVLALITAAPLTAISLPYALISAALGKGATMTVYAAKQEVEAASSRDG